MPQDGDAGSSILELLFIGRKSLTESYCEFISTSPGGRNLGIWSFKQHFQVLGNSSPVRVRSMCGVCPRARWLFGTHRSPVLFPWSPIWKPPILWTRTMPSCSRMLLPYIKIFSLFLENLTLCSWACLVFTLRAMNSTLFLARASSLWFVVQNAVDKRKDWGSGQGEGERWGERTGWNAKKALD